MYGNQTRGRIDVCYPDADAADGFGRAADALSVSPFYRTGGAFDSGCGFRKKGAFGAFRVAGYGGGTGENRTCRVLWRMWHLRLRGRHRHVSFHLYGRDAKIRGKLAAGQ